MKTAIEEFWIKVITIQRTKQRILEQKIISKRNYLVLEFEKKVDSRLLSEPEGLRSVLFCVFKTIENCFSRGKLDFALNFALKSFLAFL